MQEFSFQVFEAFTAATLIYIVVNVVVVLAHALRRARVARPGLHRPGAAGRRALTSGALHVRPIRLRRHRSARSRYLFKEGMTFTLTLTALAMVGGIVFGTLLAMMRLSSIKPLSIARRRRTST